jgi:hypothetical protein
VKDVRAKLFLQKSSFSLATALEKQLDADRITTKLGTPRGRYDEHSSKSFPQ